MACAISIVIALVGFISMKSLSIEQYPNIAPPQVMVITSYTGADANTIMNAYIWPHPHRSYTADSWGCRRSWPSESPAVC